MIYKSGFDFIDKIYVINLKRCVDRRQHILREFKLAGIKEFEFFEATDKTDTMVKDLYRKNQIQNYPPCFRCHKNRCQCYNNILIPEQIANWCSFIRVMKTVASNNHDLVMICEDDIKFIPSYKKIFNTLICKSAFQKQKIQMHIPLLIRMTIPPGKISKHVQADYRRRGITQLLKNKEGVSNPCFIINKAYAELFTNIISKPDTIISCTSDTFIHTRLHKQASIQHFTAIPSPVFELSYGTGPFKPKFYSEIHPKGIDSKDRERQKAHVKKVRTQLEYSRLVKKWLNTTTGV